MQIAAGRPLQFLFTDVRLFGSPSVFTKSVSSIHTSVNTPSLSLALIFMLVFFPTSAVLSVHNNSQGRDSYSINTTKGNGTFLLLEGSQCLSAQRKGLSEVVMEGRRRVTFVSRVCWLCGKLRRCAEAFLFQHYNLACCRNFPL